MVVSPPFSIREIIFVNCICCPAHKVLSEKGSTLNGKNLLPKGANSFLLGYTKFETRQMILKEFPPLKM